MEVDLKESQNHWQQLASIEAKKNRELRYQHGTGPSNVFILDTSSSLGEEGFTQMKEAFISIINEYAKHPEIDENVAVIVCGRETKFIRYFSNHYEDIKHCLDDLNFGGPSNLTAAFYLSTGCFKNGASQSHIVGEFHIRQRIILISDGRPTDFTSTSHTNDDDAAAAATAGFDEVIKDFLLSYTRHLGQIHPIFCIPVGRNPDYTMLEFISVQSRGGKIVHRHEARQFAKYSQHITIASRLSYSMMNDGNDRERVMTSLVCTFPDEEFSEMDQDAIYEICSKKSLYGSLDRSKLNRDEDEDAFEERNPNMPRLGSRVRRGRDWKWHDQDNFGLGTVIGHCKKVGWLTVEWDTGSRNIYRYGSTRWESDVYDVQVCNEPRTLRNEPISAGCQVKRGPDWEWENQDGGAGSIGSVVTVVNNCIVLVRWQHGFLGQYRFGCNGKIDLQICDPFSQDAVRHRDELMRSAALNCPPSIQARFNEDFEKPLDSIEEPDHKTSPNLATKPILHVIKGKYFRNDSRSSDIETDGPTFSCAKGHWFWKNAKGEWNPYCRETNAKINRCYERDRKSTAVVTVQNQNYRVVMAKNIQINLETRETLEVKLVENEFSS
ncbi:uncharacterized protein [Magallana gigas]